MRTFIDLFAGCGGLSLGLIRAGWIGRFAIERHPDAFATLHDNLLTGPHKGYLWPKWLEKRAWSIEELIARHTEKLISLSGSIELIAGGPPCQGYSTAGRRNPHDVRNQLVAQYLQMVQMVRPRCLLLENVAGFMSGLLSTAPDGSVVRGRAPSHVLIDALQELGYSVSSGVVNCAHWGIPQRRFRFIAMAVLGDKPAYDNTDLFDQLTRRRRRFLVAHGLPINRPVTAKEAMADLQTRHASLRADPECPHFSCIDYREPDACTGYLSYLRAGSGDVAPNSMRLPAHRASTSKRFATILLSAPRGRSLSARDRAAHGLKKHTTIPLAADQPAPTVTTLPDDILHYAEPRILTVRELARLQSFPDWFQFRGKYTTGGTKRTSDCPRYSQVANAVPPLMAEALGDVLNGVIRPRVRKKSQVS
jgi:DNA (cytosine-5)-methyltransferase 1